MNQSLYHLGLKFEALCPIEQHWATDCTYKKQLTVHFGPDIIDWFKDQGPGYQSQMNDALRHYMNKNESRI
jgi:uncharacterized protein (DUF4415 family)